MSKKSIKWKKEDTNKRTENISLCPSSGNTPSPCCTQLRHKHNHNRSRNYSWVRVEHGFQKQCASSPFGSCLLLYLLVLSLCSLYFLSVLSLKSWLSEDPEGRLENILCKRYPWSFWGCFNDPETVEVEEMANKEIGDLGMPIRSEEVFFSWEQTQFSFWGWGWLSDTLVCL